MSDSASPINARPTMAVPIVTTATFALAMISAAMSIVYYVLIQVEHRREWPFTVTLGAAGAFGVFSTVQWARYFRDYIDFAVRSEATNRGTAATEG
jgi:hypothetical protein